MRLAFCLFKYFPHSGLARDMLRIAHATRKRGHEILIFAGDWQGPRPPQMSVEVLAPYGSSNHARARAFASTAVGEFARHAVDGVIGFNKMPGLDVYFAGDGCFVARSAKTHGYWIRLTPRYRVYTSLERAVFGARAQTQILLLSEAAGREYRAYYDTPTDRLHLLPPILDRSVRDGLASAEPARTRTELGVGEDQLVVLLVGSGFRTKGLDRALNAVAALAPGLRARCRLIVVGKGKQQPYEKQAARLGIAGQVNFLGPRDDVPVLMRAADLLLHPAHFEAAGAVLLEAAVNGLPVLTTATCGYAAHVNQARTGRVIAEPFEQAQLDACLAQMLSAPEQLAEWSGNGLAFGEQPDLYTMPETAAAMIEDFIAVRGDAA